MIIYMNESRLNTIGLIVQFFADTLEVTFTKQGDEDAVYQQINRVLKRFDFPRRPNY
jgi:hypothetical protein